MLLFDQYDIKNLKNHSVAVSKFQFRFQIQKTKVHVTEKHERCKLLSVFFNNQKLQNIKNEFIKNITLNHMLGQSLLSMLAMPAAVFCRRYHEWKCSVSQLFGFQSTSSIP